MKDNWYALVISVLRKTTPKQSFALLYENINIEKTTVITDEDVIDMIELKKTCTFKEIGYMYGISDSAIYRRIKRYNERLERR